jgi:putative serine protease PepD
MAAVNIRTSYLSLTAAVVAGALIGVGGGAATYAALSSGGSETVVRRVTVTDSEPAAASTSALSVNSIYKRTYKGVVEVLAGNGEGSGFVYDADGHIVTNEHVVGDSTSARVRFWNGKTVDATVVGTDSSTDLAVLKVDTSEVELVPLALGDSNRVEVGDNVVAIGSPFGLEETVTSGIVSALHRQMTSPNRFAIDDSIQTDAAINHGNSGGPLLNDRAQVIAVNAQIASDSGGNDGVGFAIPVNTVKSIAAQLITDGKAEHAFLGVALQESARDGALVGGVNPDTPASRAGLRTDDLIVAVDGKHVGSQNELRAAINTRRPGDQVALRYRRNGETHTVTVTLASRPS